MTNKIRGGAFRLTGLILGIVGATVSLTAIVFFRPSACTRHTCARPVKRRRIQMKYTKGRDPFQS